MNFDLISKEHARSNFFRDKRCSNSSCLLFFPSSECENNETRHADSKILDVHRSIYARSSSDLRQDLAILLAMPNRTISAPEGFRCEFTGLCFRNYFVEDWSMESEEKTLVEHLAVVPNKMSEETLEMASLVAALVRYIDEKTKNRTFVMTELGAGYGRWALNAIKLGESLGVTVRAVAVEAEPTHFQMLQHAFLSAGVDTALHRLVFGAVGGHDGSAFFFNGAASQWWGQRLCESWVPPPPPEEWGGGGIAETAETDVFSLATILQDEGEVDLVDMDIQGAELEVLSAALHEVRRGLDSANRCRPCNSCLMTYRPCGAWAAGRARASWAAARVDARGCGAPRCDGTPVSGRLALRLCTARRSQLQRAWGSIYYG